MSDNAFDTSHIPALQYNLCGHCGDRSPQGKWRHEPCWMREKLIEQALAPKVQG